jgi:hypothetical protein
MPAIATPIAQRESAAAVAMAAAGSPGAVAAPPDVSAFPVGTTTVECSATDLLIGSSTFTTTG